MFEGKGGLYIYPVDAKVFNKCGFDFRFVFYSGENTIFWWVLERHQFSFEDEHPVFWFAG